MIRLALQRYLASKPDIANALAPYSGSPPIYRDQRPQGSKLPAVVLTLISGAPDYELLGELGDLDSIVQCSVYASDYHAAHQIGELIRLAPLSGFAGQWPIEAGDDGPVIEVKAVTIRSEIEDDIPMGDGSAGVIYRATRDYQIHYERTVASVFA